MTVRVLLLLVVLLVVLGAQCFAQQAPAKLCLAANFSVASHKVALAPVIKPAYGCSYSACIANCNELYNPWDAYDYCLAVICGYNQYCEPGCTSALNDPGWVVGYCYGTCGSCQNP